VIRSTDASGPVPPEVSTAACRPLRFSGPADADGRSDHPATVVVQASSAQGAGSSVTAAAAWPTAAVPPTSRVSNTWDGLPADLFDGQAIPLGG
jgi:hypothetical protein